MSHDCYSDFVPFGNKMSHNCYSDIVPFVKHYFFHGNPEADEEASKLFNTDCYLEGECDFQADVTDEQIANLAANPITARGWIYTGVAYIGKRGNIPGHLWIRIEKQDTKIWIINTSQYCHVGEFDMAIVADESSCIKEFVDSFKDLMTSDISIEETDVVHWWA